MIVLSKVKLSAAKNGAEAVNARDHEQPRALQTVLRGNIQIAAKNTDHADNNQINSDNIIEQARYD